ncbi:MULTISPECIES: ribosome silencing factor [Gammaproteobacteria]|uniref:Ribosomal silencing factor RsfS n=1 Tax=Vreelandella halophila TaxID=86177 RepID=A0A9X4YCD2_9GAMM|nr:MULTISPECIES: ribosome silencing factor [Gammaproteobacteria]KAA8980712.1 ribosome silencing factor [Halospina sp. K52047b]MYL26628.1 ribosome silencing factor [Halomonas utahensis]MYL73965.1 ribosome silencing factor [Halomonas sp. 22501_18_FS]
MDSEQLKSLAVDAVESMKGQDVAVLDVRDRTSMTDYMVIASGNSNRHIHSLAEEVVQRAKQEADSKPKLEGGETSDWVLVDMGDVIVHLMLPATREFYDLERFWRDAPGLGAAGTE